MIAAELKEDSSYVVTGVSAVNATLLRLCELGLSRGASVYVKAVRGGVILVELNKTLLAIRISACEGLNFAES